MHRAITDEVCLGETVDPADNKEKYSQLNIQMILKTLIKKVNKLQKLLKTGFNGCQQCFL